ncbi:Dynein light chain 1, cytoplasmic [Schistosoma japonicum]|uniref:Dynein light chain n=1 Tax=Schistosoma japonicum TaxID=6182 RepID=A0A4Z2CKZ0_SCHJA|nr:Dynein light chain 1, cytoplasmic [Schistosoma japonicum]
MKEQAIIKNTDMSEELQRFAVDTTADAMDINTIEKDVACKIKKAFDKQYGPTWHCIVGNDFGSYVTHESGYFIYFYLRHVAILLFKSG